MAENIDATLEENRKLREQIEAVQIERRRNFSEADKVYEEVQARRENERLKEVLASQEEMLERSANVRDKMGEDSTNSRKDVPYTITKDGPVYSTPNHGEKSEDKPVAQSSGSRPAAGAESRPPYVPLSTSTGDDDENKEN